MFCRIRHLGLQIDVEYVANLGCVYIIHVVICDTIWLIEVVEDSFESEVTVRKSEFARGRYELK